MPTKPEQAVVRHHDRFACSYPASVSIEEGHTQEVPLSRSATGVDGSVRATVVDCSSGGLGLHLGVYLPRTCQIELIVQIPVAGAPPRPLKLRGRVQRVSMISRRPEYYLGAAFVTDDPGADVQVARLVEAARAAGGSPGA